MTTRALLVVCTILVIAAVPRAQTPTPAAPPAGSAAWDATFRDLPDPAHIKDYLWRLSARPHHVGSPYDKDNAEWLLARFKEFGWDAEIESFDVLFPTPKERKLELVQPSTYVAKLIEPPVAQDPTSSQTAEQLPPYNAFSRDGDVTGPLVYVNYGRPQDYEVLDRYGVSVKGAIVIARYGASWRGIKPKVAAEKGAIGCIIYSDPRDDGYFVDDVFPDGPARPPFGAQRGSVMDMPTYPGDPLTPGVGATPDAKRLTVQEAPTLTAIPVLPISYEDAKPFLSALKGRVVPADWRGALPLTYHFGPGPATAHLKVAFNWDIKRLYNVIARLPGSTFGDEWIVRGNHHDGWVNGAEDPSSGMAAMLEEARAMGELRRRGWAPRRTIVYTAWDGEEPALLGSTEWVEQHGADLAAHAVAYINSDGNGRGFLGVGGSHTLERFINGVARDVPDPEAGVSVWKRLQAHRIAQGNDEERRTARDRADLRINALGSGSDFTPFLQHNGVATLAIGFGGEDNDGGVYHSTYDDYYWHTQFGDADEAYGRVLAQTIGTAVIRLADADLLPFEFTDLSDTVNTYVKELQKLLDDRQKEVSERNRQIDDGVFAATKDPRKPVAAPPREDVPPALNFAPLQNAATRLERAAQRYKKASEAAAPKLAANPSVVRDVNRRLIQSERQLLDDAGLPKRPWYRHLLYAPGLYTGYSVKTVPGVREAIEQKQYDQVDREVTRVQQALDRETALVNEAASALEALR